MSRLGNPYESEAIQNWDGSPEELAIILGWKRTNSKKYLVYNAPDQSGHWAWHKQNKYWHWTDAAKIAQANRWARGANRWQQWQNRQEKQKKPPQFQEEEKPKGAKKAKKVQKEEDQPGGAPSYQPLTWNQFQSSQKGKNLSRETVQRLWKQYKATLSY